MSKRFAATCFIVLACIIIACFMFVVGLFLLPGVYIFGLKYIGKDTHYYGNIAQTRNEQVTESPVILSLQNDVNGNELGEFSGIIVNCYEVPVKVTFSTLYRKCQINYIDNFNGITTSKIVDPMISYQKDDSGNVVINISEYHTFVYESGVSNRYLELFLPFQMLSEDKVYGFNLAINSTKSKVRVGFENPDPDIVKSATFNNLSIKTNGDVEFNHLVKAKTYAYETSKTIEINEDDKISATNYNLTSSDGKIIVNKDVEGDLTCNTTLGRVLLKSCNNLVANTTFGDVRYSGDEGEVTVRGIAKISTRAGNITLGAIQGDGTDEEQNVISTTSGNVLIRSLKDGEITTQRGRIKIDSVRKASIVSKTGKIYIQEVKNNLYAKTIRSSITVGGNNMLVNNIEIHSTLGDIKVLSSNGSVKLDTFSGDVEYYNSGSTDIDIYCGGKLIAEKLIGNVKIFTGKEIKKLDFIDLTKGNVEIDLGEKCKSAYIYINQDSFERVSYYVKGKSVAVQEYKNAEWQGSGTISTDYSFTASSTPYSFNVQGNSTDIVLRFSSIANF